MSTPNPIRQSGNCAGLAAAKDLQPNIKYDDFDSCRLSTFVCLLKFQNIMTLFNFMLIVLITFGSHNTGSPCIKGLEL